MTVLLLIRHGLTDTTGKRLPGWAPGLHLSERGRDQAEALPERLAGVPIKGIYTSSLERCRETGAPLAKARGLTPVLRNDLRDSNPGDWTGRPLAQLARTKIWRTVQVAPSRFRFPGGESIPEVQVRAAAEAEQIAAAHPRDVVAVFSHADPIKLIVAHFLGLPLDLFQRVAIEPASVTAIALGHGPVPRLLRLNDTGSLADLAPRRPPRTKVRG